MSESLKKKLKFIPIILTLLFVVYVILLVADSVYVFVVKKPAKHGLTSRIQEDDPGWNCKTMGNGVCGPNFWNDPRYQSYDAAFTCFAEIDYTYPNMAWGDRVIRCIPQVSFKS